MAEHSGIHSRLPGGAGRDRLATFLLGAAALAVVGLLLAILSDLVLRGAGEISWPFLIEAPSDFGRAGGVGPILVSTVLILGVCLAVALPVGLGSALFLSELTAGRGRMGRLIRRSLDATAAVPSIVFGLFGNALFCRALGLGYSILAGGLTLACMILPFLIRTAEIGLRSVPAERRLSAAGLALSRATTLRAIILPAAAPAIVAGVVLGLGRALAETAALIFTSGYVARWPGSLLDSGRSLSIHIYDLALNVPGAENAYTSALVLILAIAIINQVAWSLTPRLLGAGVSRP